MAAAEGQISARGEGRNLRSYSTPLDCDTSVSFFDGSIIADVFLQLKGLWGEILHRTARVHADWSFEMATAEAPVFLGRLHILILISFSFQIYDISVIVFDICVRYCT